MNIVRSISKRFSLIPLFILIKLIIWHLKKQKILVINAASGLGDYLWARYYFKLYRKKYSDYKFVLIGTDRWLDFAKFHDNDFFDLFIGIHSHSSLKLIKRQLIGFQIIPVDIFINLMPAIHTVKQILKSNQYYELPPLNIFYRNTINEFSKQFFEIPTNFKYPIKKSNIYIDSSYIVIVLSGYDMGAFSVSQITYIIDYIANKNNTDKLLLIGDSKDKRLIKKVLKSTKHSMQIINGCCKYKVKDLFGIINNAKYVITPNTSIYHMCILLNKKCICASVNRFNTLDLNNPNIIHILNTEASAQVKKINEFDEKHFISAIDKLALS